MAEMSNLTTNLFSTDPSLPPGYMQLPAQPEQPMIPFSPEGWQMSKLQPMPQAEAQAPAPAPTETADKGKKKKEGVTFTPEQMQALSKLVAPDAANGQNAGRSTATQAHIPTGPKMPMQMLQAGNIQTAPRPTLGQLLYGRGR